MHSDALDFQFSLCLSHDPMFSKSDWSYGDHILSEALEIKVSGLNIYNANITLVH